jgi:hypothetical protein
MGQRESYCKVVTRNATSVGVVFAYGSDPN